MYDTNLLEVIGFKPKENSKHVYFKKYKQANDYCIEVDLEKGFLSRGEINYGKLITSIIHSYPSVTHSDFVVLECVNRLLEMGYPPQNIIVEIQCQSRHGCGWDAYFIRINRDDCTEYLLIECVNFAKEYETGFSPITKIDYSISNYFNYKYNKADVIMLYTSELRGNKIEYRNGIIKIEDEHRTTTPWLFGVNKMSNKIIKNDGIFEEGCTPYNLIVKDISKSTKEKK